MDERRAFEQLWEEHFDAVLAFVRRRADVDSAWDIAADTFLTAWRRLGDLPDDPRPFLIGIARNRLLHHDRDRSRRRRLEQRLGREPARVSPDPAEQVTTVRVLDALRSLSEQDRDVILLVAWEGLTVADAAEVLGISAGTYSVRLHRARNRLMMLLGTAPTTPAEGRTIHG